MGRVLLLKGIVGPPLRAARGHNKAGRDSNFGNLRPPVPISAKFLLGPPALTTHVVENRVMIGIVFIGVMTALAVFAILAKTCAGGPQKGGKVGKGRNHQAALGTI